MATTLHRPDKVRCSRSPICSQRCCLVFEETPWEKQKSLTFTLADPNLLTHVGMTDVITAPGMQHWDAQTWSM